MANPTTLNRGNEGGHGRGAVPQRIELSTTGPRTDTPPRLAAHIQSLTGVRHAVVNPISKRVVVEFDPDVIAAEELVRALEARNGAAEAGWTLARWHLPVESLACTSCSYSIERAVEMVAGVHGATVNVATNSLTIEYRPQDTDLAEVRKAVGAGCRTDHQHERRT